MTATDPLRDWWDALEHRGYGPKGEAHNFRARCPLHNGDNATSLHVFIGADGRAAVHCFACGGHPKEIAQAVGLDPRDSFPAGHRHARKRTLLTARRRDFHGNARELADTLSALEALRADWFATLRMDCPHCGSPAAVLHVTPDGVRFFCPGDEHATEPGYDACTYEQARKALAGQLHDQRKVGA